MQGAERCPTFTKSKGNATERCPNLTKSKGKVFLKDIFSEARIVF